jgi:hypothetical protein
MNSRVVSQILAFAGYVLFHIFIGRKLTFGAWFYNYLYVGFLLSLSPHISKSKLLIVGFLTGITIDLFEYSMGIHASACVLLAFIRPYLVSLLAARSNIDEEEIREITIREISLFWFVTYAGILIFIHHAMVFFLEAWTSKLIWLVLQKTFFSTLFTLFLVVVVQYLFFTSRRK